MFRFDFRDKSMIPPILGTDNRDYLERITPVLEREKIHPTKNIMYGTDYYRNERVFGNEETVQPAGGTVGRLP